MKNRNRAEKILASFRDYYGKLNPPLDFRNPYELCIAVVLSAQTTDNQVNRITPDLFAEYGSFEDLAGADYGDVEKIIRSVGFYRVKTKSIINLSRMIVEDYDGILPDKINELIKLPGVGRKSANVILSHVFGVQAIAVDTHVARLSGRLGFSSSKNPDVIEKDLMFIFPDDSWSDAHLYLITHGRKFCRAKHPLCAECFIRLLCPCKDKCP